MKRLTPEEINQLLAAAPAGSTIYLVGAGGCGMSGLGHLLLDQGFAVAGSDAAENSEVLGLRARGAVIHLGHSAAQVQAVKPVLVVYTPAVRLDNPELVVAEQMQVPIVRRAFLLAALLERRCGLCVAGMHGKTTTSALLAYALERLQRQPSYAIGAAVPQLARHARFAAVPTVEKTEGSTAVKTAENFFVAEADESDGTLREFRPGHSIILNVDEEHLDYYANLQAICEEFQQFADHTRGKVVFCADDHRLVALLASRPGAVSYGFNPLAAYRAEIKSGSTLPGTARFEVWHGEERLGEFHTALLGEKNISNATAVVAMLTELGFAPAEIGAAIAPFRGAARRQQELYNDARVRVFDDYGHHPAEIEVTLRALKQLGGRRLVVAFQPHRFTRTRHLLGEFAGCFREADHLLLTEVYAASEPEIPGVNGAALAAAVRATGQAVDYVADLNQLETALRSVLQPSDVVLFLGAGDITRVAHEFAGHLRAERRERCRNLVAELIPQLAPETVWRQDEPLAKRTTMRVGGAADLYVEPASEEELAKILRFCSVRELPFFMLGRGSNLLVRDGGIRGVVICLSHPNFSQVTVEGLKLRCGAGVRLRTISMEAKKLGIGGLEFLEGIPGNVGGALRMNAGAMGAWTFDLVESVRFMDFTGQVYERPAKEIPVQYRSCPLLRTHIALGAVFHGREEARELIEERLTACNQKRWKSQPAAPSAGCIFKNPGPTPAGKLIDELGLKGTRVGGAVVSDVHGNFIVNDGNATAEEVLQLIEIVRARALAERGISLETEVEIVGEP